MSDVGFCRRCYEQRPIQRSFGGVLLCAECRAEVRAEKEAEKQREGGQLTLEEEKGT